MTVSSLSTLKPVFPQWGPENPGEATTTAGNASGVGDGAALCILTTRSRAQEEGWEVLGKWVWSSITGVEPRVMGIAPVVAIPKLLKSTGLKKEDVDLWEINEAFASQFAYCVEQLDVPIERINPKQVSNRLLIASALNTLSSGGSIALTHPLGMSKPPFYRGPSSTNSDVFYSRSEASGDRTLRAPEDRRSDTGHQHVHR